jgi:hypothetical protein
MTIEQKCHDTCCGRASDNEVPNSCQKEKALVNLNFNSGPFLVFDTNYEFQNVCLNYLAKENTGYNTILIPNYSVAIWQPPEYFDIT